MATTSNALTRAIVTRLKTKALSRKELAAALSVSRTTLGRALQPLIDAGAVTETTDAPFGRGRPVTRFTLNDRVVAAIGIDIRAYGATATAIDREGRVVAETTQKRLPGTVPTEITEELTESLTKMMVDSHLDCSFVAGIGVAVDGVTDDRGIILTLAKTWPVPVTVSTRARMAAVGEATVGAGAGCDNELFVVVGHRVKAVSVLHGIVTTGAHDRAGDIGAFPTHTSGNGALTINEVASTPALLAATGAHNLGDIEERRAAGDPVVVGILDAATTAIADAIAVSAIILDPALVVVSGPVIRGLKSFAPDVFDKVSSHQLLTSRAPLPIVDATLGSRAAIVGALKTVTA